MSCNVTNAPKERDWCVPPRECEIPMYFTAIAAVVFVVFIAVIASKNGFDPTCKNYALHCCMISVNAATLGIGLAPLATYYVKQVIERCKPQQQIIERQNVINDDRVGE